MDEEQPYLVCYDISSAYRLRHVHRICKGYGAHAQFSIFFCSLRRSDRIELERDLTDVMNHAEDRLMIVRVARARSTGEPDLHHFGSGPDPSAEPDIMVV